MQIGSMIYCYVTIIKQVSLNLTILFSLLLSGDIPVVSASSDGFVKSWKPHSEKPLEPTILGSHSDYVRCLALWFVQSHELLSLL
jgi:hypothetical protein